MKIQSVSLFALTQFTSTYAGFSEMMNMYNSKARNSSETGVQRPMRPGMPGLRNLGMEIALETLNDYGCWCMFGDNHGKGHGHPLNDVDEKCRTLHWGYDCTIIDAVNRGDICIPWDVKYKSGWWTSVEQLISSCEKLNKGNWCAQQACITEGYFVNEVLVTVLDGVTPEFLQGKHDRGFEPSSECHADVSNYDYSSTEGSLVDYDSEKNMDRVSSFNKVSRQPKVASAELEFVEDQRECCGSAPHRRPYKSMNGDRACCGAKTYSTKRFECCADGHVKPFCDM